MKKILTPDEIIDQLTLILNLENDNQLATYLNVERQQIRQYRNGQGGNLNCRLLTAVIENSRV